MVCQPRNPYLLAGSRGRSYNLGSFMSSETLVAGIRLQSQPVHQLLAAKMEPDEEEEELLRQIQEGTLHESKKVDETVFMLIQSSIYELFWAPMLLSIPCHVQEIESRMPTRKFSIAEARLQIPSSKRECPSISGW